MSLSDMKTAPLESVDEKGEAFVLALIAEGHNYKSMKQAFNKIVLRTWLRLTGGRVDKAAEKMQTDRRNLFVWVKQFSLREELASIRAANEAEK